MDSDHSQSPRIVFGSAILTVRFKTMEIKSNATENAVIFSQSIVKNNKTAGAYNPGRTL